MNMEEKEIELVKRLVELQTLCARTIERNTEYKFYTKKDVDSILTLGKESVTLKEASKNLSAVIDNYSPNSKDLVLDCIRLESSMRDSEIADSKIGSDPEYNFSEIENEIRTVMLEQYIYMNTGLVSIREASETLGLSEPMVKNACQQQQLLNTTKIGIAWVVHLPECIKKFKKGDLHHYKSFYKTIKGFKSRD